MSDTSNVTDDILSNVPGLEGDDDGTQSDDQTQVSTSSQEADDATASPDATSGEGSGEGTGILPNAGQNNGPQDFKDGAGNVVARGGAERRLYEKGQQIQRQNETLTGENTTLKAQLEAIQGAGNLGTQFNLSPDQLTQAAQIMRGIIDKPTETLGFLLTQAQSAGHNIEGLGQNDMAATKQMMEEMLKPLLADRQAAIDTQTQEAADTQVFNTFRTTYPDAQPHHGDIAKLMQQGVATGQPLSVDAAYFKLKTFFLERNLDWTKPLSAHLETANAAQSEGNGTITPQGETIPTGNNGTGAADVNDPEVAAADSDTGDIVREAMKEAGYDI